jgi:hypothetical protein
MASYNSAPCLAAPANGSHRLFILIPDGIYSGQGLTIPVSGFDPIYLFCDFLFILFSKSGRYIANLIVPGLRGPVYNAGFGDISPFCNAKLTHLFDGPVSPQPRLGELLCDETADLLVGYLRHLIKIRLHDGGQGKGFYGRSKNDGIVTNRIGQRRELNRLLVSGFIVFDRDAFDDNGVPFGKKRIANIFRDGQRVASSRI